MVKKIAIAIWILTASFLGILVVNYVGNRKMIENYGQGVYQQNELGFLGFTQPYINHFNKGNVFYQLGDYQKAKQEYQLALNLRPDEPYDCKIRVNYALSYVTPIDVDDINEDNYKDVIEICETAKSILAENDCATENNDGHYYAAQKLYNEINQFIEDLKNQYENPPTPTPTATPTPNPENGTATPTPSPKPDADATETPTVAEPDNNSGGGSSATIDRLGDAYINGEYYLQWFGGTYTPDQFIGCGSDFDGFYKDCGVDSEFYTAKESSDIIIVRLANGGDVTLKKYSQSAGGWLDSSDNGLY